MRALAPLWCFAASLLLAACGGTDAATTSGGAPATTTTASSGAGGATTTTAAGGADGGGGSAPAPEVECADGAQTCAAGKVCCYHSQYVECDHCAGSGQCLPYDSGSPSEACDDPGSHFYELTCARDADCRAATVCCGQVARTQDGNWLILGAFALHPGPRRRASHVPSPRRPRADRRPPA